MGPLQEPAPPITDLQPVRDKKSVPHSAPIATHTQHLGRCRSLAARGPDWIIVDPRADDRHLRTPRMR